MDFKKDLKIGMSAVGKMYIVCALLRNEITCLYGNTTSEYFQLQPPSLHETLATDIFIKQLTNKDQQQLKLSNLL